MRPELLIVEGLRSYRDTATVDFSELGLTALIGDTGAGKSSLIEALSVALYNRSTWSGRGGIQALRSDNAPLMRVVLTFTVAVGPDRQRWTVTRIHRPAGNPIHKLVGEDTGEKVDAERKVNERIEGLIGLTHDQFTRAVAIPQGQFARLLEATPAERTKILKGIFRLDEVTAVKEHADQLYRRYQPAVLLRKGARVELPADLEHALGTSKEAASQHAGRFAALCGAEETATGHINAAEQATSAAERLQLARREVTQRIDPKATPALERAVNAEKEIAGLIQTADEARRAAELEAEEAQRQAGSALAPFTSRDDAVAARSTIDEVRRAARDLEARTERLAARQRELDAPEATQRLVDAEQQAKQARELAEAKRAVAERAKEDVRGAQERFREKSEVFEALDRGVVGSRRAVESTSRALQTAIEANALATVAGSCQPGDDCPVCERPLPDDFAAPTDPQIDRARRELADAEEGLRDLEGQLERAKTLRDEAELELTTAREAHEAAADEARTTDRQATEAESDHSGLVKADESLRGELGREEEALGRERARCQELLHGLPGDLQLKVTDDAAASEALAQIEDRLAQAQAAMERADDARRGAQQERTRAEEAQGRRQHEVTRPATEARQTATLLADRVHSINELLQDTEPVPEAPAADAGVADLARWVALLQAAAGMALVKAQAAADEATAVAAAEQAAADAACHGVGVENFQDLKQAVLTAKGEAEVAAEEVRRLDGDIARAAQLDRFLEIGEPFVANLETLRVTLTDGQFVRALVAERERELLVEASKKFKTLTNDNFGFGDGFAVVDRRTLQQRPAETLSGGELFLASLALALALVEIATRGGGQLDAMFLDEGFGSLDTASLDQALATLGGLAVGGKLVMLVSHLRRVAEHVEGVLMVERNDVTGSRVRKLDPDERDALLAEDVRSGLTR